MKAPLNSKSYAVIMSAMLLSFFLCQSVVAQNFIAELRNQAYPINSNGLPIKKIEFIVHDQGHIELADSARAATLQREFGIHPGATFNINIMAVAMKAIEMDPYVKDASYSLYHSSPTSPLTMVVEVTMLGADEHKHYNGQEGMAESRNIRDFPLIYENKHAQLSFILNAGVGLYDDVNAYFGQGDAIMGGNATATDIAGPGSRFWGEASLEPGLRGTLQLGNSNIYAFGAISAVFTGRNTSDIYSGGHAGYIEFEKLYGGLLFTRIGHHRDMTLRLSYGRQDFQLNDGFLISKWSGSANADNRASNYMLARTAFSRMGLAKFTTPKWALEGFYIAPDEQERHHTANISYAGAYVGYNDNRHWNVGIAFIDRITANGCYDTGTDLKLPLKGMYAINPKVWIDNIAGTGVFFRSEYVFEGHKDGNMAANAWYAGAGINMSQLRWNPRFYYRYCYQQGDNPRTKHYTRFDHILSGGLAEWVQGVTTIKLFTRGNMITHKIQAQIHPAKDLDFIVSYHYFRADKLFNPGDAAVFENLNSKHLADEITLQTDWNISPHFMLMGIASVTLPGKGIKKALPSPVKSWSTFELSCFMFF